jgi:hypothetical protein
MSNRFAQHTHLGQPVKEAAWICLVLRAERAIYEAVKRGPTFRVIMVQERADIPATVKDMASRNATILLSTTQSTTSLFNGDAARHIRTTSICYIEKVRAEYSINYKSRKRDV